MQCYFGRAIWIETHSTLILTGINYFSENTAISGGGSASIYTSFAILMGEIIFSKNLASFGRAIILQYTNNIILLQWVVQFFTLNSIRHMYGGSIICVSLAILCAALWTIFSFFSFSCLVYQSLEKRVTSAKTCTVAT